MAELAELWDETLARIAQELPRDSFETWVCETYPLALYEDTLVVGVPNPFARTYIKEHFGVLLQSHLSAVLRRPVQLQFVVPPEQQQLFAVQASQAVGQVPLTLTPAGRSPLPPPRIPRRAGELRHADSVAQPLNPRYTFETFVIGSSNRLAHAACLAVADAPAQTYNPLFLYGGVGLGKTHLMQAIAHHVLTRSPDVRIAYVSCETFGNELIDAIQYRKTVEFRARYRSVDILLVDDIQFLAGKESTQEEFFHTFNALHESSRQLVLSSDRPPKEIPTLEERLRSRFEWGLISDIQPPDLETRTAILRQKLRADKLSVPDDVIDFIAQNIQTNIRELEGALIRLIAYASMHREEITLALAKEALKDLIPQAPQRAITVRDIMRVVAQHYRVDIADFTVRKRTRAIAYPRQVAMYLTRLLTDASLPRIGEEFGGRDHTTVIHACEKIGREIEQDPALAATVEKLKREILAQ